MATVMPPTEDEPRPDEDIDRLALRISLADDDEQFEKVIHKSLIFILKYLSIYEEHRKKLMELLGDVTRRLKFRPNIQLPIQELFLAYNDPGNSVFLINFSHIYLKLGYPRMPASQQINLLPVLFSSLSENKPIYQKDSLLHITLPFIGNVTPDAVSRDVGLSELAVHRRYVSDFYCLILLFPYSFPRLVRLDGNEAAIPDGFNSADLNRVLHDRVAAFNSAEELEKFKVNLIQFYSRHFFPAEESIIPILFGYGDSRHSVVSIAAKELRTLSMIVDWEDEMLLNRILTWYLGRRREFDPKGRNEPRRPLSPAMRIKLGHYLLRSRITLPGHLAPSLVEAALLALESATVPTQTQTQLQGGALSAAQPPVPRLHADGHHCEGACGGHQMPNVNRIPVEDGVTMPTQRATAAASLTQRKRLAEHGLDLLAHLINNVSTLSGPASVTALRCLLSFVYEKTSDEFTIIRARAFELLSRFLARDPNYLLKDPAQLPRLFDVLSEDNPNEVKSAAASCLRRLAITFQEAQKQNHPALRSQLGKLERLLYENIEKSDPLCRVAAVNFAGLIYPSDHIPTRYLILQALGDKDQNVRKEACLAFEQFLDPNIIHDIVYGRVKLPSFVEFVNHDTQHSRKNPFVEVERLIPVVQFIRLCLLASRGGLTPAQEAGLTYETEDEVRYLVNQTVRYFLSASSPIESGSPNSNNTVQINPEQAKRSIDTYFRLIQVVIFTRSQQTKDSPNFPNYLEEVLVGNTKELITCNKQLFDRMNSVLLATPRGASCRHACASVYSVVVMETETPAQALQTAKNMLSALPSPGTRVDGENSHTVQGMFMGAAYLLERLFTRHIASPPENGTEPVVQTGATSKKGKKEKQRQQQRDLRSEIISAIEHMMNLMSPFLIKPSAMFGTLSTEIKERRVSDCAPYTNSSIAQSTVASLLESIMVIARAGCLCHLPTGSFPVPSTNTSELIASKANLLQRIACYLPSPSTYSNVKGVEASANYSGHLHVAQAALRALSACCMGEGTVDSGTGKSGKVSTDAGQWSFHPHTVQLMKQLTATADLNDPSLHLAVGISLADCLLGRASPLRKHWYERTYPLVVSPEAVQATISSPAGRWLATHLEEVLKHRPGQVQARPSQFAAVFWVLALVRRIGPLPASFLPDRAIISLLEEKDDPLQCVAVATLGQIYDRSSDEARAELVNCLIKFIQNNDKRLGSPVYRELVKLSQQVGRPDLALCLIVLAIAPPPNARLTMAGQYPGGCSLAGGVTYAGLVRRFGRALAPVLPRLVPRVFIRRFDCNRPKLRQAMENVWISLVLYTSSMVSSTMSCSSSTTAKDLDTELPAPGPYPGGSVQALTVELVEAHFNAIVCEIKTQLGFNANQSSTGDSASSTTNRDGNLRDACCLAISNLATHPAAEKRLSGHLPALLSGLLGLCDEDSGGSDTVTGPTSNISPPEEAAIAVQKLVIRVLENPCSREAATSLLPGLLPVIIDRAPWTLGSLTENTSENPAKPATRQSGESRRLALELLLAAARTARPSALRPALPQLILAGLHTMSSVHPSLVASLMRQPVHHLHQLHTPAASAASQTPTLGIALGSTTKSPQSPIPTITSTSNKEIQMAEVLRLCVRLIDDVCLSRLIVPFTELIRAGGGVATTGTAGAISVAGGTRTSPGSREAAATATATCVFLSHLAAANATAFASSGQTQNHNSTCLRCSASSAGLTTEVDNANESPGYRLHPSPTHVSPQKTSPSHASVGDMASSGVTKCSSSGFASLVPHTGKLLAALLSAIPGACKHPDSAGKTVQVEMARTLASLLRFAKDTSVAKLFNRVRSWYLHPEMATATGDSPTLSISHWACARVMHAVGQHCPELLLVHSAITLPLIFLNRQPETDAASPGSKTECSLTQSNSTQSLASSLNETADANKTSNSAECIDEFDLTRPLWHEIWVELSTKIPTSPCTAQLLWPGDQSNYKFDAFSSNICNLADCFLRSPMLDNCMQLLSDALLECPSWAVRTQATVAVLSLSARLLGLSHSFAQSASVLAKRFRDRLNRCYKLAVPAGDGDGQLNSTCEPINTAVDAGGVLLDKTDPDNLFDELTDSDDGCPIQAWVALVQLTTKVLKMTKFWPGKVYLLRASRLLAVYARERSLAIDDANQEIVYKLWCVLAEETHPKRNDTVSAGYMAEAFLSFASFVETTGKSFSDHPNAPADAESDADYLFRLLHLIVPQWSTRPKQADQLKKLTVNPELTEIDLEIGVRAIGILWPLHVTEEYMDHFSDTISLLSFVLMNPSRRVQAASLASTLGIMAKLTPEETALIVKRIEQSTPSAKPAAELGLKDLLVRIKRVAENPKSQLLREHALGCIATLLRHPSFLTICHEQVIQVLRTFGNDGVTSLRDCAAEMLKSL